MTPQAQPPTLTRVEALIEDLVSCADEADGGRLDARAFAEQLVEAVRAETAPPEIDDVWHLVLLAELQRYVAHLTEQARRVGEHAATDYAAGLPFSAVCDFITAYRLARSAVAMRDALALLVAASATTEYALAADDDQD